MSYKTGQILYLLPNEEMKIIPVQVVEVTVRHRFNEDVSTSYSLLLPGKNSKIVNLEELDVEVFTDIEKLRKYMVDNATISVDKMIGKAMQHAENYFATGLGPVQEDDESV